MHGVTLTNNLIMIDGQPESCLQVNVLSVQFCCDEINWKSSYNIYAPACMLHPGYEVDYHFSNWIIVTSVTLNLSQELWNASSLKVSWLWRYTQSSVKIGRNEANSERWHLLFAVTLTTEPWNTKKSSEGYWFWTHVCSFIPTHPHFKAGA